MVSDLPEFSEGKFYIGLNPYSTGRWFLIAEYVLELTKQKMVLILILLEDGFWFLDWNLSVTWSSRSLNPYSTGRWFLILFLLTRQSMKTQVLILILLEDGFWLCIAILNKKNILRLNPYSTGRWFLIKLLKNLLPLRVVVLILILLEDGFW